MILKNGKKIISLSYPNWTSNVFNIFEYTENTYLPNVFIIPKEEIKFMLFFVRGINTMRPQRCVVSPSVSKAARE